MKLYLLLAVAAVMAALGAWGYVGHASARITRAENTVLRSHRDALGAALKTSEAERKRIASVSRELTARLKAQAANVAAQKKELNEALKANPDWASAPVPDGVWNALGIRGPEPRAPQPGPGVDGAGGGAAAAGPVQR